MNKLLIALIVLIIIIVLLLSFDVIKFEAFTTEELNTLNAEALGNISSVYNKDIMITPQLRVMGNANIEGSTTLKGGLNIPAGKPVSFDGDVVIKGKLNGGGITGGLEKLPDDVSFKSLAVSGNTLLNGGLTIPVGKTTKLGNLNIDGQLTVNGNVIFPKSSSATTILPTQPTTSSPVINTTRIDINSSDADKKDNKYTFICNTPANKGAKFVGPAGESWFPYTNGENYIRGTTHLDGDIIINNKKIEIQQIQLGSGIILKATKYTIANGWYCIVAGVMGSGGARCVVKNGVWCVEGENCWWATVMAMPVEYFNKNALNISAPR